MARGGVERGIENLRVPASGGGRGRLPRAGTPQAVQVRYGKFSSDGRALALDAGVGSQGSHLRFEFEGAAVGCASADSSEFLGVLHGAPARTPRCRGFWGTG